MTGTDNLKTAMARFDRTAEDIGACGDGYCVVMGKARGQHTNGGCRCWQNIDKYSVQRLLVAVRRLRDALEEGEAK